jgi:ParB family transcriptional regulator, chromosome partitioning protein
LAKRKTGLGRGLAELLGEVSSPTNRIDVDAHPPLPGSGEKDEAGGAQPSVLQLPINSIRSNPRQPRRSMDVEGLKDLADSIAALGIVQPVIVRTVEDGGYELIAGERRWKAAQMAGFTVIPAIARQASDTESLEIALVENVVRQQLNPVDEAYSLQVLLEDLGVTQDTLASQVGMSRSAIANKIRLLELPEAVQAMLAEGSLTEGHGRALLGLKSRGKLLSLARRALERGLSVRAVEAEVHRIVNQPEQPVDESPSPTIPPELVAEAQDRLYGLLEIVPRIRPRGDGGQIEVPFRDQEDLRRIIDRLAPGQ